MTPNYAFKRTAEQALRSKQIIVPQPLNAALDCPVGVLRGAIRLSSFLRHGYAISGMVVLCLSSATFVTGCTRTPVVEVTQVECEVSDEQVLTFAKASAGRVGATFPGPEKNHVELYRHGGRIGYIGARYLASNAIEMHRELIIWMQCDGVTDTVLIGQSLVYQRAQ